MASCDIFPDARMWQDAIGTAPAGSENILRLAFLSAILSAVTNSARSCTVATTGYAGAAVAHIRSSLANAGYDLADLTNGTVQVSW